MIAAVDSAPISSQVAWIYSLREQIRLTVGRTAPEDALILDFDETLWLRNSTEAFLDQAKPRFFVALLLKVLDFIRPWRFFRDPQTDLIYRDWLRVLLVVLFTPWSLFTWRRAATQLGLKHLNPELWSILRQHPDRPVYIVSNGFRCIVAPLVLAMGDPRMQLLASPLLTGFRWRKQGKRYQVERSLGAAILARAVVVTDNREDDDLLAACAHGFRHRWPDSRYIPAMQDVYMPFDYMENVKRPGKRHFLRVVLADDLIAVWLVYLWSASNPLLWAPVLLLLHLAFWVVYEIGYAENDRLGALREADPVLSDAFHHRAHRFSEPGAWMVAGVLSSIALCVAVLGDLNWRDPLHTLGLPTQELGFDAGLLLLAWMGFLLAVRGLFRVYNHLPKPSRVLPFFALQMAKLAGFAIWIDLPLVGVAVILAYTVTRWVPYVLYRHMPGVEAWSFATHRYRLMLFLAAAALLAIASPQLPGNYLLEIATVSAWFLWKLRREIALSDKLRPATPPIRTASLPPSLPAAVRPPAGG